MKHPYFWMPMIFLILLSVSCNFGKNAEALFNEGMKELKDGKTESAYKLFKSAAKKEIKSSKYSWAAASIAPNQNESFIHTKAAWDNGLKTPFVLLRLTSVAFHTSSEQKMKYALSLYDELPDSVKTNEFRGDLFFQFEQYDSSLSIWKPIESSNPTPGIVRKIALCYQRIGDQETLLTYLEKNRKRKLLNSSGYMMLSSVWLKNYDYAMVDSVYKMAVADGVADDAYKTDYASLLLFRNNIQTAQQLLREVNRTDSVSSPLKLYASMLLSYSYTLKNDSLSLKACIEQSDTTDLLQATVKKFSKILFTRRSDTTGILQKITDLYKKIPSNPMIQLVFAQELQRCKRFGTADSIYRQLPAILFFSPPIAVEVATLKVRLGKDNEALALINQMHENNVFNKRSLELFRDLTFKKKLFQKSAAAQKLLQQKFKDDVTVQWSGALLALGNGKIDSAITLFTDLAKKYPSEEQFETMRITAILLKGDYQAVLKACSTTALPVGVKNVLQARAWRKIGNIDNAKNSYEAALKSKKNDNIDIYMEYAEYLLEIEDHTKASSIFAELLRIYEKVGKENNVYFSSILNNFAWTAMNSQNQDQNTVISAVKKAYELQPSNLNIIDTYATALLKYGNNKECISLLKDKKTIATEVRLLVHLAQAYEKTGEINKAVRLYQDALAIPDSIGELSLKINKVKLDNHLQTLLASQN